MSKPDPINCLTASSAWPKLAADLEQILLTEPGARAYVDVTGSRQCAAQHPRHAPSSSAESVRCAPSSSSNGPRRRPREPALRAVHGQVVGKGVLGAEITQRLLPTLTQSFALTASVIFLAFLLVFRSPSARLMTMIPSLFAILSVFLVMRLTGIPLNIATILIGSTILGATENDQIHFFYHFQEGRSTGTTAGALQHAMLVAGRPILFATLINVSGFLALVLSDLPPMREFGIVASSAFVLALLADFTALPGALWILSKYDHTAVGRTAAQGFRPK